MPRFKPSTEAVAAHKYLKSRGWSYRAAAPHLGITFGHLHRVLKGERISSRILTEVMALPERPNRPRQKGAGK